MLGGYRKGKKMDIIHFNPKKKVFSLDAEKSIRCKCGKYWGMDNHKFYCDRCKTKVTFKMEHKR